MSAPTVDSHGIFALGSADYMKVDGCGGPDYYDAGYKAMGAALQA
eukprot:SAG31_NODE_1491_length_8133_cov_8.084267_4_plen_45_part_00